MFAVHKTAARELGLNHPKTAELAELGHKLANAEKDGVDILNLLPKYTEDNAEGGGGKNNGGKDLSPNKLRAGRDVQAELRKRLKRAKEFKFLDVFSSAQAKDLEDFCGLPRDQLKALTDQKERHKEDSRASIAVPPLVSRSMSLKALASAFSFAQHGPERDIEGEDSEELPPDHEELTRCAKKHLEAAAKKLPEIAKDTVSEYLKLRPKCLPSEDAAQWTKWNGQTLPELRQAFLGNVNKAADGVHSFDNKLRTALLLYASSILMEHTYSEAEKIEAEAETEKSDQDGGVQEAQAVSSDSEIIDEEDDLLADDNPPMNNIKKKPKNKKAGKRNAGEVKKNEKGQVKKKPSFFSWSKFLGKLDFEEEALLKKLTATHNRKASAKGKPKSKNAERTFGELQLEQLSQSLGDDIEADESFDIEKKFEDEASEQATRNQNTLKARKLRRAPFELAFGNLCRLASLVRARSRHETDEEDGYALSRGQGGEAPEPENMLQYTTRRVSQLWFSQKTISPTFSDVNQGAPANLAVEICAGRISVFEIPAVRVLEVDHGWVSIGAGNPEPWLQPEVLRSQQVGLQLFSLDNRRLHAMKCAQSQIFAEVTCNHDRTLRAPIIVLGEEKLRTFSADTLKDFRGRFSTKDSGRSIVVTGESHRDKISRIRYTQEWATDHGRYTYTYECRDDEDRKSK
ncbi:unnamed protein product [Amoebophrya sp. A120]|nr:unnamed protein product [Amoebophrya sp. A120]|eukprot:GSA120T00010811001.1